MLLRMFVVLWMCVPLMENVSHIADQRMPVLRSFEPSGEITTFGGRRHLERHNARADLRKCG